MSDLEGVIRNMIPFEPGRASKEQRFEVAADTFAGFHVRLPAKGAKIIQDGELVHHIVTVAYNASFDHVLPLIGFGLEEPHSLVLF